MSIEAGKSYIMNFKGSPKTDTKVVIVAIEGSKAWVSSATTDTVVTIDNICFEPFTPVSPTRPVSKSRSWEIGGFVYNEVALVNMGWTLKQLYTLANEYVPERIVCDCGKGYASPFDNMCRFCREKHLAPTVALRNKYGVRPKGYGLTLNGAYGPL